MSDYLIVLGQVTYEPRDGRAGFTLTEALREVYGSHQAALLRLDGTVAVANAGSAYSVTHIGRDGYVRTIRRRPRRRSIGRVARWSRTDPWRRTPVRRLP